MQKDGHYYEGFYSLLDGSDEVTLKKYDNRHDLLKPIIGHWPVKRLQWFSKGYYKVWQRGGDVVVSDLRMGYEPDYVFSFVIGKVGNPHVKPVAADRIRPTRDLSRLSLVWQRIWSAEQ